MKIVKAWGGVVPHTSRWWYHRYL